MTFKIENFEVFLLILVRITGFVFTAPFFSLGNVPTRVKTGFAIFLTAILFYSVPYHQPEYDGIIGFSVLVILEAIAGAIMGLFANIAYYIVNFAGQLLDMEIGFSMVTELDPINNVPSTITANLYGNLVLLIMIISNMHHYFIRAVVDSFQIIGIGAVRLDPDMYQLLVQFITDYFVIGFRIVLPVFASMLVVNTILAILTKIAPQMNMFVIGIQIKIVVGLVVLVMMMGLLPSVADFIFNEMITMMKASIQYLK
jgi:flagellar biosynthetic protein FliR